MNERSALLFVHSPRDVPSAVKSANELLTYRRRNQPVRREALLGICASNVDELLQRSIAPRPNSAGLVPIEVGETVSLSGLWTLAFLDGVGLSEEPCARARRVRVLETLVVPAHRASPSKLRGSFHTVFTVSEPEGAVGETLSDLRRRFTDLIGDQWFVDNPTRGLCGPLLHRGERSH